MRHLRWPRLLDGSSTAARASSLGGTLRVAGQPREQLSAQGSDEAGAPEGQGLLPRVSKGSPTQVRGGVDVVVPIRKHGYGPVVQVGDGVGGGGVGPKVAGNRLLAITRPDSRTASAIPSANWPTATGCEIGVSTRDRGVQEAIWHGCSDLDEVAGGPAAGALNTKTAIPGERDDGLDVILTGAERRPGQVEVAGIEPVWSCWDRLAQGADLRKHSGHCRS